MEADMLHHIDTYSKTLVGKSPLFQSSATRTAAALEQFVSKLPSRTKQRVTQLSETQTLMTERATKRQVRLSRIEQAYNEIKTQSKEQGQDGRYASYMLHVLKNKLHDKMEREQLEEEAFAAQLLMECDKQQRSEGRMLQYLKKKHQQAQANRGLQLGSQPGSGGANYSTNKVLQEEGRRISMRSTQTEQRRDTQRYQETRRRHLDEKLSTRWMHQAEQTPVILLRQFKCRQTRQAQARKANCNGDRMLDANAAICIVDPEGPDNGQMQDYRDVDHPIVTPISMKETTKYKHTHPKVQQTSLHMPKTKQNQAWTDTRSLFISPNSRPSPFVHVQEVKKTPLPKQPNYMRNTKVAQNRQKTTTEIIHHAYESVQRTPITSVHPSIDSVLTKSSPHHIKNMKKKK